MYRRIQRPVGGGNISVNLKLLIYVSRSYHISIDCVTPIVGGRLQHEACERQDGNEQVQTQLEGKPMGLLDVVVHSAILFVDEQLNGAKD